MCTTCGRIIHNITVLGLQFFFVVVWLSSTAGKRKGTRCYSSIHSEVIVRVGLFKQKKMVGVF